jgi:Ca2+-binding RTX toxin-like protein
VTVEEARVTDAAGGATGATAENIDATSAQGTIALYGNAGNNQLTGNGLANVIVGGAGADTITGAGGADNMSGDDGNDVFIIALAADHAAGETISGGGDTDVIRFTSTANATLTLTSTVTVEEARVTDAAGGATGATAENIDATSAQGTIALYGNAGNNQLTGNGSANVIVGGAGNDTITGAAGTDNMTGGAGADVFVYTNTAHLDANETVDGGNEQATDDTVRLDVSGAYNFVGFTNVDNIDILALNADTQASTITLDDNVVSSSDANNDGTSGDLEITDASPGTVNTFAVNINASALTATRAINVSATTFGGADSITGGAGADTINGGAGNDTLIGNDGNDVLIGGAGTNVIWAGKGQDAVTADAVGAINRVIVVGNLATANADKITLVNTQLGTLIGNAPNLTNTYTTDVVANESIVFADGDDILYTFGDVDLSLVNITGNYSIVAHSSLTIKENQFNSINSITFVGPSTHNITIKAADGSTILDSDQTTIFETWGDRAGQQLAVSGNAARVTVGVVANGGENYDFQATTPQTPLLTNELFAAPVRSAEGAAAVPVGSPFATSVGMGLRWDAVANGYFPDFANTGDQGFTSPGRSVSNVASLNDRFAGLKFVPFFEPGYTQLPIPKTFGSYGDNAVHREQFEVYSGSYDVHTGVFQITKLPGGTNYNPRSEFTMILYDDDPTVAVGDVEGIVFINQMEERDGWRVLDRGTDNARLEFNNVNLNQSGGYGFLRGDDNNNTIDGTAGGTQYLYGRGGSDVITAGVGDFVIAGSGADTVFGSVGENIIDLGHNTTTWNNGDGQADVLVLDGGGSSAVGNQGQDFIYNFEFARDIIQIRESHSAAGGPINYDHSTHVNIGGDYTTDTITVNLNGDGAIAGDDLVFTLKLTDNANASAATVRGRFQYNIEGSGQDDTLVTGGLNDTVIGGAGNDNITGGGGADSLDGGIGNDSFTFANITDLTSAATVIGGNDTDTITVTAQITVATNLGTQANIDTVENLVLTGGSTAAVTLDTAMTSVTLNAAGSVVLTAAGQDVTGSAGIDTVRTITGVTGTLALAAGNNVVEVGNTHDISAATVTAAAGAYDLRLLDGGAAFSATVSSAQLTGGTVSTQGNGAVTIIATNAAVGTNAARYTVDSDIDILTLGNFANFVIQGAVGQVITGNAGVDTVTAINGVTSTSDLAAGANVVVVTNAANVSAGTFNATGGTLSYNVDAAATGTLNVTQAAAIGSAAGVQNITLSNQAVALALNANVETFTLGNFANSVTSDGTAHIINGGTDADEIDGGGGADTITGGAGADELTGGAGDDDFVIAAAGDTATTAVVDVDGNGAISDGDTITGAFDVITDFETAASGGVDTDTLDIQAVNAALIADLGNLVAVAGLAADEYQIIVGDYVVGVFTVGILGADTLVAFNDGANDVAVVLTGVTDFAFADLTT